MAGDFSVAVGSVAVGVVAGDFSVAVGSVAGGLVAGGSVEGDFSVAVGSVAVGSVAGGLVAGGSSASVWSAAAGAGSKPRARQAGFSDGVSWTAVVSSVGLSSLGVPPKRVSSSAVASSAGVGSSDGVASAAIGSSSYDMRYCFTRGNRPVYGVNRLSRVTRLATDLGLVILAAGIRQTVGRFWTHTGASTVSEPALASVCISSLFVCLLAALAPARPAPLPRHRGRQLPITNHFIEQLGPSLRPLSKCLW